MIKKDFRLNYVLLIFMFLFISNIGFGANAYIHGEIQDCHVKIGVITHYSSVRVPDLNEFQDIWFDLEEGKFQIQVNNFTDGDYFKLKVGEKSIIILLFDNDNLKITSTIDKEKSIVFEGQGAARNNALELMSLFNKTKSYYKLPPFDKKEKLLSNYKTKEFILRISLLGEIYNNISDSIVKQKIKRVANSFTVDKKGYNELHELISAKYHYHLINIFRGYPNSKIMQSFGEFFEFNKAKEFVLSLKRINHPIKSNILGAFVSLYMSKTFLEEKMMTIKQAKDGNIGNMTAAEMSEQILSSKLVDVFYSHYFYPYIKISGKFDEMFFNQYKSACEEQKYYKYIRKEQKTIKSSLENTKYKLNDPIKELDNKSLIELVNMSKGKVLVLVFWSRRNIKKINIPYLNKIIGNFSKSRVIYICLDEMGNKDYWAYQLIKNNIHGEHYFYPTDEIDSIKINKISLVKDRFGFHPGDWIYFIDKKGTLAQLYYCSSLFELEKSIFDLLKKLEAE